MNLVNNWRLLEPAGTDGAAGGGGVEPPPAGGDTGSADDSFFSDLAAHDDMAPMVAEPAAPAATAAPTSPSVTPPAAVSPPAAAPAAGTPPGSPSSPAAPVAPAATPAAPPGAPAAGAQPAPASTEPPVTPAEPFDPVKHRDEFVPKLAEQLYALSPEEVEAARTDPGATLPVMAARVHYNVQHAVFAGVMQALPQMMEHFSKQQAVHQENERMFFEQFPDLKAKPEYAQTVIQSIQAVRTASPNLPREELMKRAGVMAMLTLGLQPSAAPAAPTPTAPPAAPRPTPAQLRPAGAGAQGHVPPPIEPGQESSMDDLQGLIDAHLSGTI